MGCFEDCCDYICEPYGGNMPLFSKDQTDATVTIVQEAYDDGMKVTKIQTPPRTESSKLIDAINSILGMFGDMDLFKDKKQDDKKPSKKSDKKDEDEDDNLRSDEEYEERDSDGSDDSSYGGFGSSDEHKRVAS